MKITKRDTLMSCVGVLKILWKPKERPTTANGRPFKQHYFLAEITVATSVAKAINRERIS